MAFGKRKTYQQKHVAAYNKNGRGGSALFATFLALTLVLTNTYFWWNSLEESTMMTNILATTTICKSAHSHRQSQPHDALPSSGGASPTTLHTATTSSTPSSSPTTLLNHNMIRHQLLREAPWAESHGADHSLYLGAGMLYYGLAYAFQCHTIVVLGSGGGFVPRILRQAQRDLQAATRTFGDYHPDKEANGSFDLILVDAHMPESGFGSTFYAENHDTVMRQEFSDIRYIFETTDTAFEMLRELGIRIDYLHIDADHSTKQTWRDFAQYSTLLSERGVISFHDTCHDAARNCRTGVPQVIQKLQQQQIQSSSNNSNNKNDHLSNNNFQLIDAHYLYRGVAFAIPMNAPALDPPAGRRRNFCRTNADILNKTSPGFSLNKYVGSLPTLGDFYDCHARFNMTDLLLCVSCPLGKRRNIKTGHCGECIPGLEDENCRTFGYAEERANAMLRNQHNEQVQFPTTKRKMTSHRQHLVAAWLAEYQVRHIFEYGVVSNTTLAEPTFPNHRLHDHNIQSIVAMDPLILKPVWTGEEYHKDGGEAPILVRWLPCQLQDVLQGGRYHSTVVSSWLQHRVDAFVCWHCDDRLSSEISALAFSTMLDRLMPHVRTLVLDGSAGKTEEESSVLDVLVRVLVASTEVRASTFSVSWEIEADLTLTDQSPGTAVDPRRMLLLKRTKHGTGRNPSNRRQESKQAQNSSSAHLLKSIVPLTDFFVAGVNLGLHALNSTQVASSGQEATAENNTTTAPTEESPFELFDDFDLSSQIMGNETWKDLVRYRRDAQRQSLCFYVDKVARRRWMPTVGLLVPKTFLLQYASELTSTGKLHDEKAALLRFLRQAGMNYAAKPTHLSCSGGVWLTKQSSIKSNTLYISHGTKHFQALPGNQSMDDLHRAIADSLAHDLHEGPRCGSQRESWALENVKPGVMIEERFTAADEEDDTAGGMEFKVVTIWGRVWMAQWRPGVSSVRAFIHRNGTSLNWNDDEKSQQPLPEWIDWPRIVSVAEQLGAHKDMFRTDIFVGIPAGSAPLGSTREEKLARVEYVVSETEIHPTRIKGTDEVFKEGGRLWLAGYKSGNYRVIANSEVPSQFVKNGVLGLSDVTSEYRQKM